MGGVETGRLAGVAENGIVASLPMEGIVYEGSPDPGLRLSRPPPFPLLAMTGGAGKGGCGMGEGPGPG
ncbi:hypothetical protein, partial [Actinoplanes sp. TFC3]|uniref:hypothetical protein n=1 Tax=Actinoplanes sp. TFC3 TaxID=1710355 RepID=UPI001F3B698B